LRRNHRLAWLGIPGCFASERAAGHFTGTITALGTAPLPPTITTVVPNPVEKSQTTVVGTVKPGIAGDTLAVQRTSGLGTLSCSGSHLSAAALANIADFGSRFLTMAAR